MPICVQVCVQIETITEQWAETPAHHTVELDDAIPQAGQAAVYIESLTCWKFSLLVELGALVVVAAWLCWTAFWRVYCLAPSFWSFLVSVLVEVGKEDLQASPRARPFASSW